MDGWMYGRRYGKLPICVLQGIIPFRAADQKEEKKKGRERARKRRREKKKETEKERDRKTSSSLSVSSAQNKSLSHFENGWGPTN